MTLNAPRAVLAILPGPAVGVIKAVLDLYHDQLGDQTSATQATALIALENDVRALKLAVANGSRISGARVDVLSCILQSALRELGFTPDTDEVIALCQLSPAQVKDAFEDLAEVDLVDLDPSLGHVTGYARARLEPTAYLRVGTSLLPDIPVCGELWRVLTRLNQANTRRIGTIDLLASTGIPLPRLDLLLNAMVGYDFIAGGGPGDPRWGRFMHVELQPGGKRLLRRDEPIPWDAA